MRSGVVACALLLGCGRSGFNGRDADASSSGDSVSPSATSTLSLDLIDPGMDLDDFPLLVRLDDTRAARDLLDATGSNIRFFDSSGNVLSHEIDTLGTAGNANTPLLVWVRVPAIVGTTTTLTVQIGGTLPAKPAQSVWATQYAAVYHMGDGHDSTTNGHDGMPSGNITNSTGAITDATNGVSLGRSQTFDGASYYSVPDAMDLGFQTFTITGWLYQRISSSGVAPMVARDFTATANQDFMLASNAGTTFGELTLAGGNNETLNGAPFPLGTWTHLALEYDGTSFALYSNGVLDSSYGVIGAESHDAMEIKIGAAEGLANAYLDGSIDELRLENAARPVQWLVYDDQVQRDAVISYGPIER